MRVVPSSKSSREVLGALINPQLHMCTHVFLNMFSQNKDHLPQKNVSPIKVTFELSIEGKSRVKLRWNKGNIYIYITLGGGEGSMLSRDVLSSIVRSSSKQWNLRKHQNLVPTFSTLHSGPRSIDLLLLIERKHDHSSYKSLPRLPAEVCFFQASVLLSSENAKFDIFWPIMAIWRKFTHLLVYILEA